MGHFT